MAGPRYSLKSPDGVPLGELDEDEVCRQIDAGTLMLDSLASIAPDTHFLPITQYPVFAVAFESRYGLGQPGHTSDSTPVSHSALLEALHRESELVSPISTTRPALEGLEDTAPATIKNTVGLLDEPTPVSLPSEPATPIGQASLIPEADTLTSPPPATIPEPRMAPVMPAMPTLTDAPESEFTLGSAPIPEIAAPTTPLAPTISSPRSEPHPPSPKARSKPQLLEVSLGIGAWAIIFLILTVAGHRLGLGPDEARLLPSSTLYWARIILLSGSAALLLWAFPNVPRLTAADFGTAPTWALAAILVGTLAGASFPGPAPGSPLLVALLLTTVTVVAEELFFRAYLGRVLEASFPRPVVSVGLAAALYGVYASTLPTVWIDRAPISIVLRIVLLTVGAGVPLALLQHWARSLLPSLLCHLALAFALVLGAAWRG
ncbi:MAG: CPBP family intramembrane metalloprotease [Deltaproteobacteria bacterium]|nr:CPBP family intramembrane metalloprotease [Deltaproteobacteria bacterium]